jgi:hypothetical protein
VVSFHLWLASVIAGSVPSEGRKYEHRGFPSRCATELAACFLNTRLVLVVFKSLGPKCVRDGIPRSWLVSEGSQTLAGGRCSFVADRWCRDSAIRYGLKLETREFSSLGILPPFPAIFLHCRLATELAVLLLEHSSGLSRIQESWDRLLANLWRC